MTEAVDLDFFLQVNSEGRNVLKQTPWSQGMERNDAKVMKIDKCQKGEENKGEKRILKQRAEEEKTRQAWREATMPTIGANAIITLMFAGSGLCSSQGLPLKRVESSLQDINKPRGRQRP